MNKKALFRFEASPRLGATAIEKHITLSRAEGGVDAAFSLEPHELKQLCEESKNAALAIGTVNYDRSVSEQKNTAFRRSIYAVKDIAVGEEFTRENIRIIRPDYGGKPKDYEKLLGKQSDHAFQKGQAIT